MFRLTKFSIGIAIVLGLSACSSSSSDSDDPGVVAVGGNNPDTTENGAGVVTDNGTTGNGNGNNPGGSQTSPSDIVASLSHEGTLLARGPAAGLNDPLVSSIGRSQAAALPQPLGVMMEAVENHGSDTGVSCKEIGAEFASCSVLNLHIKDGNGVLNNNDWKIYFHSIRRVLRVDSDQFDVVLVNGDLNYITPSENYQPFAGDVASIKLITEFNYLVETDFMPRFWLVQDGGSPELIANTDSETDENTYAVEVRGLNAKAWDTEPNPLATSTTRFAKNQPVTAEANTLSAEEIQLRVVPQVSSLTAGNGTFSIADGLNFSGGDLSANSAAAVQARASLFAGSGGAQVSTTLNPNLAENTYTVDINASGIAITGRTDADLFYGAQTVLGLIQPGVGTLPYVSITDSPRFDFRGMHIDVARNFHSLDTLKKLVDQMAAYKMNKLHMHLSDDEGWRLEIRGLPELTGVGGQRNFQLDSEGNVTERFSLMPQLGSGPGTDNQGSGFYTRAQFIELLNYATDRHVDVIPEIDMPAHARAAVVAMRARAANLGSADDINVRIDDPADTSRYLTVQHYDDGIINPCVPGTYNFLETVVGEVASMYTDAGLELEVFHMGGDEAKNVLEGNGFEDVTTGGPTPWRGTTDQSLTDLPWERSPACADLIATNANVSDRSEITPYFIERVSEIVADAGIPALYAYQDIYREVSLDGNLEYEVSPDNLATTRAGVGFWEIVWDGGFNSANLYSNLGFETIIAVPDYLYFDFPHEVDPKERGFYWATRFTDTHKVFTFAPENLPQNAETSVNREGNTWTATGDVANQGFIGMQGQLWSETVRTPEQFDYMVFPRLLALAERAWHKGSWENDYQPGVTYSGTTNLVDKNALNADFAGFASALATKELRKLDAAGIQYRIPVPGTNASSANVAFPGLPIQYSVNGTNFTDAQDGQINASATAIRATSADGRRVGRATAITQ